jgi:tetratricopeptide (TPR) repeat protein
MRLGKFERASSIARALLVRADAIGHGPLRAEILALHGELQQRLGAYEDAERTLGQAVWTASLHGQHDVVAHAATLLTAVVGVELGQRDAALAWAGRAREALVLQPSSAAEVYLAQNVGNVLLTHGAYEQAIEVLAEGIALHDRTAPGDSTHWRSLHAIGMAERRLGRYEAATEHHRQAVAAAEAIGGPHHPDLAIALTGLGAVHYQARRFDESAEAFSRAATIAEAAYDDDHPILEQIENNLGVAAFERGLYDEAGKHWRRALALAERVPGRHDWQLSHTYDNLGKVALKLGDVAEARRLHERAVELWEARPGDAGASRALINLGRAERSAAADADARVHFERADALLSQRLGSSHADRFTPLLELADLAVAGGDFERATELLHTAAELDGLDADRRRQVAEKLGLVANRSRP